MNRIVIVQTITPDYRSHFFSYLRKSLNNNFELYGGNSYFQKSIKDDATIKKIKIKNLFLFQRRLLIQLGIWHLIFKNDTLILELNPRIISNWIILFLRKILKKETILWGHAWSRRGKDSKTEYVRNFMRKLASRLIVYTFSQRDELLKKMPKKLIYAAPNAMLEAFKMQTNKNYKESINIIYVGRLTPEKKTNVLG